MPTDVPRERWVVVASCLARSMVVLDVSIVTVALPAIDRARGAGDLPGRPGDRQTV